MKAALTQTEITSPPHTPEFGSLRHVYCKPVKRASLSPWPHYKHSIKMLTSEGVGVVVEDDRRGAEAVGLRACERVEE